MRLTAWPAAQFTFRFNRRTSRARGLLFYRFDELTDLTEVKNAYRANLDEADWRPAEKDQLIDEALRELSFQRRGKKIVAAIARAIESTRRHGVGFP